jgi:hypothetical protein
MNEQSKEDQFTGWMVGRKRHNPWDSNDLLIQTERQWNSKSFFHARPPHIKREQLLLFVVVGGDRRRS